MAIIEQDYTIRQEVQPITDALQKVRGLLEESFNKMYPDRLYMSLAARQIKEEARHPVLEAELERAIKDLAKHAEALTQLSRTIYLDQEAYKQLEQAAGRSKWIPKEYSSNEWLADCVHFLEHGHPMQLETLLPINLILHCPKCHTQHIDAPETEQEYTKRLHESSWWELGGTKPERWANPPHRSHLCHSCGHIWRPADVFTNGVAAIKTKGANDASN